jgi:hypothetical protein
MDVDVHPGAVEAVDQFQGCASAGGVGRPGGGGSGVVSRGVSITRGLVGGYQPLIGAGPVPEMEGVWGRLAFGGV